MTTDEIREKFLSDDVNGIYGYMHGHPFINVNGDKKRDEIIFIRDNSLRMSSIGLVYVWGFPGPDCNMYYYKDYGITWAFSKDEIKNVDEYNEPTHTFEEVHGRERKEFSWNDIKDIVKESEDWVNKIGLETGDIVNLNGHKFTIVNTHNPVDDNAESETTTHHVIMTEIPDTNNK